MAYPLGAVERAMKVQEVVLRTLDGKLSWLQAADVPGRSPRSTGDWPGTSADLDHAGRSMGWRLSWLSRWRISLERLSA